MKHATYDELLDMPPGTIFTRYQPEICEGLFRKGETEPVCHHCGSVAVYPHVWLHPSCKPLEEVDFTEAEDGGIFAERGCRSGLCFV